MENITSGTFLYLKTNSERKQFIIFNKDNIGITKSGIANKTEFENKLRNLVSNAQFYLQTWHLLRRMGKGSSISE